MESWKRTYWAIWFSNLITAVGMMSILPFFSSHLEALGMTDRASISVWTGVIFGAAPLMAAFTGPFWGALGDRYGRRLMVVRSMLAIVIFVGAMRWASSPWELLVLRAAQGCFSGFYPPSITLVSTQAPADQQARLAGSLATGMIWGGIMGPVFGEFLRGQVGVQQVYLGVSVLAALAVLVVLLFVREDHTTRQSSTRRASPWRDLRELRGNSELRSAVLLLFWIQFALGASTPQLELYVGELESSFLEPSAAWLFSALAVANLVAMSRWGRYGDLRGHQRALTLCTIWSGAALVLHALAPGYEVLLVARVMLGLAAAGSGPLAFGVAAAATSVDRRGGAFGVVFSARALAGALSAMAGGWISAWIGVRGLFLAGAVVVWFQIWWIRRGPASPGTDLTEP